MKIAVGMSGGVDSSVAAYLLKKAGHEVAGAIMKIWDGRSVSHAKGNSCYGPGEQEDVEEASAVCDALGIPLHVIDCSKEYNRIVLKNFDEEYCSGRTPNPCILCNRSIKFGLLPSLLEQSGAAFDCFATGHYARTALDEASGRYLLKKGKDAKKDQSYFLYRLTQRQLSRALFPLGEFTKDKVRAIAREAGLPVHDKKESQDFYSGDYTELLSIKNAGGDIVDTSGKVLGRHNGIANYTIGQRKGLGVCGQRPSYVLAINPRRNEVVIGNREGLAARGLRATDVHLIVNDPPARAAVKSRSASGEAACSMRFDGKTLEVIFDEPQMAITPGQSAVAYNGDVVIGGGIIQEAIF